MSYIDETQPAGFPWGSWISNVNEIRTQRGHPYDQPLDVAVWQGYYNQGLTPAAAVDLDDKPPTEG